MEKCPDFNAGSELGGLVDPDLDKVICLEGVKKPEVGNDVFFVSIIGENCVNYELYLILM